MVEISTESGLSPVRCRNSATVSADGRANAAGGSPG